MCDGPRTGGFGDRCHGPLQTRDGCTRGHNVVMNGSTVTLCVLLWAAPGRDDELIAYEDRVLPLVGEYGGRVLSRARSSGENDEPLEVHMLEFPSSASLDGYMQDERRAALRHERDRAIARTEIIRVQLV